MPITKDNIKKEKLTPELINKLKEEKQKKLDSENVVLKKDEL